MSPTPYFFLDEERGLEVVGIAQGAANCSPADGRLGCDRSLRQEAAFPAHHMVVRPEGEDDPRMRKGIAAWAALEAIGQRAGIHRNRRACPSSGR